MRHDTEGRPEAEQEEIGGAGRSVQVFIKVDRRHDHAKHTEDIGRHIVHHIEDDHVGTEEHQAQRCVYAVAEV